MLSLFEEVVALRYVSMVNVSQWRNLVARCCNMMLVALKIVHDLMYRTLYKKEANYTGMIQFMVKFK